VALLPWGAALGTHTCCGFAVVAAAAAAAAVVVVVAAVDGFSREEGVDSACTATGRVALSLAGDAVLILPS